jgi:hypothetical protein
LTNIYIVIRRRKKEEKKMKRVNISHAGTHIKSINIKIIKTNHGAIKKSSNIVLAFFLKKKKKKKHCFGNEIYWIIIFMETLKQHN